MVVCGYLLSSQIADFAEVRVDSLDPALPDPNEVAH